MAWENWEYYLSERDSHEKVNIPEWFKVVQLKQEQHLDGRIYHFDIFPRSEIIEALNQFEPSCYDWISSTCHQNGIDYLKKSEVKEFKITATCWT
ncbi:hypothetical protein ACT3TH_05550 [Psychrobacter sp. AOP22-C1-C5]|uniref:hypothetical protein n=1 Tax=Psychrobacter sp. AOP22-C1-C5 TaxID=3457716 RepID=UPI0040370E51